MNDYLIREAEEYELDNCACIIRESFADVAEAFALTRENCPTNGAFIGTERLVTERQRGSRQYVLEVQGKAEISAAKGFAALSPKRDKIFELEKLAVLPQYRHRGYGRALLDFAAERAASFGAVKITIGIIHKNTRLRNWYADYGFISTGTAEFSHLPFLVEFMELSLV